MKVTKYSAPNTYKIIINFNISLKNIFNKNLLF